MTQDMQVFGRWTRLMSLLTMSLLSPFLLLALVPLVFMLVPVAFVAVPIIAPVMLGGRLTARYERFERSLRRPRTAALERAAVRSAP